MENINKVIKSFEPMMHNLLHKYGIKKDYEDCLQALRIVAYKVIQSYRPKRAKLSTVLYASFNNKIQSLIRAGNKNIIAESRYTRNNPNSTRSFIDNYSNKPNALTDDLDYKFLLAALNKKLTPIDRKIVKYKQSGFSQAEIAAKIGKSQQRVSQRLKKIKAKLNELFISRRNR